VPRYAIEELSKTSTWQRMPGTIQPSMYDNAFAAGIRNPVGMTLQDAGWKWGPWINAVKIRTNLLSILPGGVYFDKINTSSKIPKWKFSQDDVLTSLVWDRRFYSELHNR
jgi:alpha-mannosidase